MRSLILFEDEGFADLLPLTYWRSVFELQVGRKLQLDRIAQRLGMSIAGVWTRDWIAAVAGQRCAAPANHPVVGPTVLINGRWIIEGEVNFGDAPSVGALSDGGIAFVVTDDNLAASLSPGVMLDASARDRVLKGLPRIPASGRLIHYPWEVVRDLNALLCADWDANQATVESDVDRRVLHGPAERFHIGERVVVHPTAVIDASTGPIYLGDDVYIGAQAVLEGPLYVGPGSRIHPRAWLHGGNAIGPVCKIGGEVHGCVIHGYSNKQHDGFLGHAYVGNWVNIGAGANNSDLKNTYTSVSVPLRGRQTETGMQFFGAVIGDHAKIGINATIPTGAVIGMGASIAATRVLPRFVPSFAWVNDDRMSSGDSLKALDVAATVMSRRNVEMTDDEVELFLELGQRVKEYEAR